MTTSQNNKNEFSLLTGKNKEIWQDKLYMFLDNVFRVKEPIHFWKLIIDHAELTKNRSRKETYQAIMSDMKSVSSVFDVARELSSLIKQKRVISGQVGRFKVGGDGPYLEIGTTGRYWSGIKKSVLPGSNLTKLHILHDRQPVRSLTEFVDTGFANPKFIDLSNYSPFASHHAASDSGNPGYALMSCFVGLHHAPKERLDEFARSLAAAIKPGGFFLLRDHDCANADMVDFVSLIHSVFNIGTGEDAETDSDEIRLFEPLDYWVDLMRAHGLHITGHPIYQENDPSLNALMCFRKA